MKAYRLSFTIPISQTLNSNQRLHHFVRASRTSELRLRGDQAWRRLGLKPLECAHATAWFTWPDAKLRDDANWYPTVKALIDGAVSGHAGIKAKYVGILPDDDAKHLPALTFRRAGIERRLNRPSPHVRIELAFEEVEA